MTWYCPRCLFLLGPTATYGREGHCEEDGEPLLAWPDPRWSPGRELKPGGHGRVFLATGRPNDPKAVIKIPFFHIESSLDHDEFVDDDCDELEREGRILARAPQPWFPRLLHQGTLPRPKGRPIPYLVMEFAAGDEPLGWLRNARDGATGRAAATVELLMTICEGLVQAEKSWEAALAGRPFAHRDLKPANLKVSDEGVRILDLGSAVAHWKTRRTTREALTVDYAPPERVENPARPIDDRRGDVWSLGVILHTLLTGGQHPRLIFPRFEEWLISPDPWPSLPDLAVHPEVQGALQAVLARALSKDPAARHASAGELRADLARVPWVWRVPDDCRTLVAALKRARPADRIELGVGAHTVAGDLRLGDHREIRGAGPTTELSVDRITSAPGRSVLSNCSVRARSGADLEVVLEGYLLLRKVTVGSAVRHLAGHLEVDSVQVAGLDLPASTRAGEVRVVRSRVGGLSVASGRRATFERSVLDTDGAISLHGVEWRFRRCLFTGEARRPVNVHGTGQFERCGFEVPVHFLAGASLLSDCWVAPSAGCVVRGERARPRLRSSRIGGPTAALEVSEGGKPILDGCVLGPAAVGVYVSAGSPRITACAVRDARVGATFDGPEAGGEVEGADIVVTGTGLVVRGGASPRVAHARIRVDGDKDAVGLQILGSRAVLHGCHVEGRGAVGVRVAEAATPNATECTVIGSWRQACDVNASGGTFSSCTFESLGSALRLASGNPEFDRCVFSGSEGIRVDGASTGSWKKCRVSGSVHAVSVSGGASPRLESCTLDGRQSALRAAGANSAPVLEDCDLSGPVGVLALSGASPRLSGCLVESLNRACSVSDARLYVAESRLVSEEVGVLGSKARMEVERTRIEARMLAASVGDGTLRLSECVLENASIGVSAGSNARVDMDRCLVRGGDSGVEAGAADVSIRDSVLQGHRRSAIGITGAQVRVQDSALGDGCQGAVIDILHGRVDVVGGVVQRATVGLRLGVGGFARLYGALMSDLARAVDLANGTSSACWLSNVSLVRAPFERHRLLYLRDCIGETGPVPGTDLEPPPTPAGMRPTTPPAAAGALLPDGTFHALSPLHVNEIGAAASAAVPIPSAWHAELVQIDGSWRLRDGAWRRSKGHPVQVRSSHLGATVISPWGESVRVGGAPPSRGVAFVVVEHGTRIVLADGFTLLLVLPTGPRPPKATLDP